VVSGRIGIDTFEAASLKNPGVTALMPRVAMRVDPSLDGSGPPLTQARIAITLRSGRVLTQHAWGARGYPSQPASDEELDAKFLACAQRALPEAAAGRALALLRTIETLGDIRALTVSLADARASRP
jgi:2-methylcitrate dehydratase PrpD